MSKWIENIAIGLMYAFVLLIVLSATFGGYYLLMLMAKKVFF